MEKLGNGGAPELVTNIEVIQILSERIQDRKANRKHTSNPKLRHRDWIEEQVYAYLKKTPCIQDVERAPALVAKLRADPSKKKSGEIAGFGLTNAEGVQVLNFMPQESVELHLMIQDLQSRMSDERQEELLKTIGSYTSPKSPENAASLEENGDAEHDEYDADFNDDALMKEEPS